MTSHVSLSISAMSAEQSQAEMRAELSKQSAKTLEEQKKREAQDALVRRLQKRVLLLTKVPKTRHSIPLVQINVFSGAKSLTFDSSAPYKPSGTS